jgi:pimeloyl-ACP methyl ester carboxylesterase
VSAAGDKRVGPVRRSPVHVAEKTLEDLRLRLERTRWPTPVPGSGWEAGADVEAIESLCDYWRCGYDWRAQEQELNRLHPCSCEIDGLELHFWHLRSGAPGAVPLLLLHGWPSSVLEFLPLTEPLTEPAAPGCCFDLVIPSLPGFGFGGRPAEPGWGITRTAEAFRRLMTEALGYRRFGIQGGDWGALIGSKMAATHPDAVLGLHLSTVLSRLQIAPELLRGARTPAEREAREARARFDREELGYAFVQSTRPMSLAVAQTDSPAGFLAWIVEKLRSWSDSGGDVEAALGRDFLLGTAMFYWAPGSIASAARLYWEAARDSEAFAYDRLTVPTAIAALPRDVQPAVRAWVETVYPVARWTDFPAGGHFAAVEQPQLLSSELRAFFGGVER